jgi:predicted metal-dependent hydrolase
VPNPVEAFEWSGISFSLLRHPRRQRLSLRIPCTGPVEVLAPQQLALDAIYPALQTHLGWIEQQLRARKAHSGAPDMAPVAPKGQVQSPSNHRCGPFEYLLVRRPRSRLRIKIAAGQLQVIAPLGLPLAEIHAFILSKSAWINKHQAAYVAPPDPGQQFISGGQVDIFGQPHRLALQVAGSFSFSVQAQQLHLAMPLPHSAERLRWGVKQALIALAQEHILARVQHYAQRMGRAPTRVTIKEYRSRWGSCNRRGELQFNWVIMQAPAAAVDYVIAHEMSHLIHFDHSPAFWQQVYQLMPDYQTWRTWFSQQGSKLHI